MEGHDETVRRERVLLAHLRRDGGTQLRQTMDMQATQEYAEALARGEAFPPVVVFDDGRDLWLSDGFHRYDAHVVGEETAIECEIRAGTRRDAILYAARANRAHGVRLKPGDREKIITTLVVEFPEWGVPEIALHLGVVERTVYRIAERLKLTLSKGPQGRPRKSESCFTCVCGESFPQYVWHCFNCDHHWPGAMEECGNCHAARETARSAFESAAARLDPLKACPDCGHVLDGDGWCWDCRPTRSPAVESAVKEISATFDAILSDFEEKAREELKSLLTAPGVPEERALEAARNVAGMPAAWRQRVLDLATSRSALDREAAVMGMRGLPFVHPAWSPFSAALGNVRRGLPALRGTGLEAQGQAAADQLAALLAAVEADERNREHGTTEAGRE